PKNSGIDLEELFSSIDTDSSDSITKDELETFLNSGEKNSQINESSESSNTTQTDENSITKNQLEKLFSKYLSNLASQISSSNETLLSISA
ncbi:MAG: hypothetical protein HXX81_06695, partial [Campylobacterales bacterium]|nr:hypothetical protein [Campylobacterales bacterium]